jgi:hypothetical protein
MKAFWTITGFESHPPYRGWTSNHVFDLHVCGKLPEWFNLSTPRQAHFHPNGERMASGREPDPLSVLAYGGQ